MYQQITQAACRSRPEKSARPRYDHLACRVGYAHTAVARCTPRCQMSPVHPATPDRPAPQIGKLAVALLDGCVTAVRAVLVLCEPPPPLEPTAGDGKAEEEVR